MDSNKWSFSKWEENYNTHKVHHHEPITWCSLYDKKIVLRTRHDLMREEYQGKGWTVNTTYNTYFRKILLRSICMHNNWNTHIFSSLKWKILGGNTFSSIHRMCNWKWNLEKKKYNTILSLRIIYKEGWSYMNKNLYMYICIYRFNTPSTTPSSFQ